MSNFFEQLVARTQPTASRIQPRRASRFEAPVAGEGEIAPDSVPPKPTEPARIQPRPADPETSSRAERQTAASESKVEIRKQPAPATPVVAAPPSIRRFEPIDPALAISLSPAPKVPKMEDLAKPPAGSAPHVSDPSLRQTADRLHAEIAPPSSLRATTRETGAPVPSEIRSRAASLERPAAEPASPRRLPVQVTPVAARSAAPPTPAQPAGPAAPVVRISIGTIEVRAVIPPAPAAVPRKATPPQPTQSLNEYLARRDRRTAR